MDLERAVNLALSRYLTCPRTEAGHVTVLHSIVQGARRQRVVRATPPLPRGQRYAPGARLAAGRSREWMRKAETEGQIKGVAHRAPESQSARGLAAAPRDISRVPCRRGNPHGCGVCRVPFAMVYAMVRWGLRHGQP